MTVAGDRALTWLAFRQIRTGSIVVLGIAVGMTALVIATARSIITDRASVDSLEALAGNPAIRTLFGTPWALDTAGGFTVIDFLADNPDFAGRAADAGFAGLASIDGFAATLFMILSLPVGGFTAVRLAAFAEAESDRRLTPLAAGPITRIRLLGTEAAATALGALVLLFVAAAAMWLGLAAGDGPGLPMTDALAGALNVVPVVLLCLAASVLALAWIPRGVAGIGGFPATGGFLVYVLALDAGAPGWVVNLSPFAHLAPVPQQAPHWTAAAAMVALALAALAAGSSRYRRRDLRG